MENNLINRKYDWLKENEDGSFIVTAKGKEYVLVEQTQEIIDQCTRLSKESGADVDNLVTVRCIESPKMTDADFGKLKASAAVKLRIASAKLHGLGDFQ